MGHMDDALRNIKKAQQIAPDNKDIQQAVIFLKNEARKALAED